MKRARFGWIVGAVAVPGLIVAALVMFLPHGSIPVDQPWEHVRKPAPHTSHAALLEGPFADGPAVTRACLECHADAATEMMRTAHWNWEGDPVALAGHDGTHAIGKKNLINNFCISVQSNWPACTSCHAGYGWKDETFDFSVAENVDCLVCHETTGTYVKSKAGLPAEGVDLAAAARSVARPTRENCGSCHFKGGGGDAVKHGDLDTSLLFPPERVDVHMGKHQMVCIDCHHTEDHLISGRSISVSVDSRNQVSCTDCHVEEPHADGRLNAHTAAVACQTCHIPQVAIREATKTHWDWSEAGQDLGDDPHKYLKKKGSFVYERRLSPDYYWYDGTADRYILGDRIDPAAVTPMNSPRGDIRDPEARIWPFKVHRGKQIYDAENLYFLVPKTVGEGGYWAEFDWDKAVRLGSEKSGLPYSGSFDFAATEMFWPLTHMVAPAGEALECRTCHGEGGILDWEALGYAGDPITRGGRPRSSGATAREKVE